MTQTTEVLYNIKIEPSKGGRGTKSLPLIVIERGSFYVQFHLSEKLREILEIALRNNGKVPWNDAIRIYHSLRYRTTLNYTLQQLAQLGLISVVSHSHIEVSKTLLDVYASFRSSF